MHDIVDLETRGVPGVFVASDAFIEAAGSQSRALGMSPAGVYVAHPIQDRTDLEMERLADAAVEAVLAAVERR